MPDSISAKVARLDERLNSIDRTLTTIVEEMKAASEGRRRVYEAQERTEREIIGIQHRIGAVEKSVAEMKEVTDEVTRWKQAGMGALAVTGIASSALTALVASYWSDIVKIFRGVTP